MKKPNFFIIGAPKCGTTSLATWIGLHSKVYMSENKEPNYFSTDIYVPNRLDTSGYQALFEGVSNENYIGEASTRYLYSKVACQKILSYSPEAKFIAIIRNPVDMIYSLHNHLRFLGVEPIVNFEEAFRVSSERVVGRGVAEDCNDPDSLLYKKIGLLGEQIELFCSVVPHEQRLILCFDDLKSDPESVYEKIIGFLGLELEERIDFSPINKSMAHRSKLLSEVVSTLARFKKLVRVKRSIGLLSKLQYFNRIEKGRPPLSVTLRNEIMEYFYQDVKKLECCMQRDLSHWYTSLISS